MVTTCPLLKKRIDCIPALLQKKTLRKRSVECSLCTSEGVDQSRIQNLNKMHEHLDVVLYNCNIVTPGRALGTTWDKQYPIALQSPPIENAPEQCLRAEVAAQKHGWI
jgi:hypothetical protein